MKYIIDSELAEWVRKIFHWFVIERRSISWIVRKLNELNAPKDHRSTTPDWHHTLVTELLSRTKYIGIWPWGASMQFENSFVSGGLRAAGAKPGAVPPGHLHHLARLALTLPGFELLRISL